MRLRGRQSLWLASTLRAVFAICFGEVGKVFCPTKSIPMEFLLDKKVVFELDSLTNTDKAFFIEALLLWIHHYRMAEGNRETFKHAIIIEEAHHILLRKKMESRGEEAITDVILREIRELGESIIVVDQHPSLISPTAIGNTYCTIAMNLKHRNDMDMIDDTLLLEKKEYLNKLPIGYGIVKLQGRYFDPFLVKFPYIPVKKGSVADVDVRKRMKGFFRKFRMDDEGIEGNSGFSAPDKIEADELRFLVDVSEEPFSKVSERYSRMGLNHRRGTEVQKALIWRGMVKPARISLEKTWIKLFDITDKGRAYLREEGYDIEHPSRKGGVVHRYWVHRTAEDYRRKGYEVEIEKLIGGGKTIDLVVTKGEEVIAVEVETGKSDAKANEEKCREAGYDVIRVIHTAS